MGIVYDDAVIIRQSEGEEEPSVITVNCPDKTGLGCDLCHIILFFGLTVVRIGMFFEPMIQLIAIACHRFWFLLRQTHTHKHTIS